MKEAKEEIWFYVLRRKDCTKVGWKANIATGGYDDEVEIEPDANSEKIADAIRSLYLRYCELQEVVTNLFEECVGSMRLGSMPLTIENGQPTVL